MTNYHSTYKGCNIYHAEANASGIKYVAYYEDGMYGYAMIPLRADTLKGVKKLVTETVDYYNARIARAYAGICNECGYGLNTEQHKEECK